MSRKHNHKMATRPLRLHPFERQNIRREWSAKTVDAQLLALMGDDAHNTVDAVGRIFYVVLGAAMVERLDAEGVDMRILRGAVNALADVEGSITDSQRISLSSGLEAVKRIVATMREESLLHAATHAQQRLQHGPVVYGDFLELARPRRSA